MSAYYNASQKSAISKGNTTLHKEFLATNEKFTRYDIPVGSVIRLNTTYRYRPEAWVTLDTLVASEDRPARVTAATTVVDAAWWANWGYRAFNVQTKTSGTVMTEDGKGVVVETKPLAGMIKVKLSDKEKDITKIYAVEAVKVLSRPAKRDSAADESDKIEEE